MELKLINDDIFFHQLIKYLSTSMKLCTRTYLHYLHSIKCFILVNDDEFIFGERKDTYLSLIMK